jgi:hypothetical protein
MPAKGKIISRTVRRADGRIEDRLNPVVAQQIRIARPWWALGEHIAAMTKRLRIRECGGCRRRRTRLNRLGWKLATVIGSILDTISKR